MPVNTCAEYCEICDRSIGRNQFAAHENQSLHKHNEADLKQLAGNRKRNPDVKELRLPPFHLSAPATINEQISQFIAAVHLTPQECCKFEKQVLDDLLPTLFKTFGKCRAQFFGSMTTGLAFLGSDVDIFVEIDDFKYDENLLNRKHEQESKIHRCSRALYKNANFSEIEAIYGAKVPIVKMVHVPTKVSGDISFKNPLGVERSRLMQYYLHRNQTILEVMLIIKYWAKRHGICSGQNSISSYNWILMFIAYLQTVGLAASLHDMQKTTKSRIVYGCRADFSDEQKRIPLLDVPKYSHMDLLTGFFNYYKHFPFGKKIVSAFLGRPIDGVTSYQTERENRAIRMCLSSCGQKVMGSTKIIQDIFDHGSVYACRDQGLAKVQRCLAKAADICQSYQTHRPTVSTVLVDLVSSNTVDNQNAVNLLATSVGKMSILPRRVCSKNTTSGFSICVEESELRVVETIGEIFTKIMTFQVTRMPTLHSSGNSVHRLKCTPIVPPAWLHIQKEKLSSSVESMLSKTAQEFQDAFSRKLLKIKRIAFKGYKPKTAREFLCSIAKRKASSVFEISFQPCVSSPGFVVHLSNFLRTSLEEWVNSVLC